MPDTNPVPCTFPSSLLLVAHIHPVRSDVKVGHWVVLRNHWVVGPIMPPKYPEEADQWALMVQCGNWPTGWTVVTGEIDGCGISDDPHSDSIRRIMFTGTKKECLDYASRCTMADEVMEKLLDQKVAFRNPSS